MSALHLGQSTRSLRHNARRALIVRRHRAMLRDSERPRADHAGSPDAYLQQLPSSLVGE